ncbi:retroviral-like aspartic protease family protein [Commensalibacter nepenthis]|uniref:Retroviral-like aspartic protease family protein n=1 Tax=Commensalibacter nepenthis TaxID=3043872 RepID=A0ABT6Q9Y5_9PROT|nr:retroviral-like aspartic protease family protein [Commensalibacter sp. TBRC 10068]MDI2113717.1 retroviral-like aspartic protease family protein [Commensalibacter sp. TBRC 10068]
MKKSLILYLLSLFILFLCAVPSHVQAQSSCDYEKLGQVPLQDVGGFLLITVNINGHPFNMVVDTGSEGSLISPEGAKLLNLPIDPNRQTVVQGPRGGQELVKNVFIRQMKLGQLTVGPLSVPLGNLPTSPRLDIPVIGLIGGDILSHFDLDFNIKSGILSFWNIQSYSMLCHVPPFWGDQMQSVPLKMVGHRPFVVVKVDNNPLIALLDSGARSRIVKFETAIKIGVPYHILTQDPGGIASGVDMRSTRYYWHKFKTFQLGQDIEHNPILTVSPLQDSTNMLIGSDWFASRHVWVSYSRHRLFFMNNGIKGK